jgi:hypothetical protein
MLPKRSHVSLLRHQVCKQSAQRLATLNALSKLLLAVFPNGKCEVIVQNDELADEYFGEDLWDSCLYVAHVDSVRK